VYLTNAVSRLFVPAVGLVNRGQVNDANIYIWRLGCSIKFRRNKALGQLEGT